MTSGTPDTKTVSNARREINGRTSIDDELAAALEHVEQVHRAVVGTAVNLAARVQAAADDDSIFVSSTVHDLLLGGRHTFDNRGPHTLKGFEHT